MKRYFIYACERMYGGLHGMEDYGVFDFDDSWTEDEIYKEYVCEMSFDVMNSYGAITEDLVDRDDYDNEDEYWEAYEEAMWENVDGYVVRIRDDVALSTGELNKIACNLGPEMFKEEYCIC